MLTTTEPMPKLTKHEPATTKAMPTTTQHNSY